MVRGKVELKAVENPITLQVTFGKRRTGLLKKAQEISLMCDSEVALIFFSNKNKLFQYATNSRMEQILQRYETHTYVHQQLGDDDSDSMEKSCQEYIKLLSKVKVMQTTMSHLTGEDLDSLKLRGLQRLEQHLDIALKRIRAKKNQLMNESISELQKKGKAFQEKNRMLARRCHK